MALIKCRECGHDVSNQAKTCPNCGAATRKGVSRVHIAAWLVFLAILSWFFFSGGVERSARQDWKKIGLQVANEAVAAHELAKKGGDAKGMCVQANVAASAFLRAQDEKQYQMWKDIEKADCKAARMAH
jgi:hypothetical protein